ncbi:MAG: ParB/RepB/Spo0J family partition protein [Agathobacter rectalis]
MKKQEELYSFPQQNDGAVVETDIRMIPLSELHDFNGHPFKVENDMALFELMQSIEKEGVVVPALARPREDGGYELIAGHRRKAACKWAGLNCMPVVVRDLDDNQAVIAMVDSNLQREHLKPSEKAFAYKMKLEAIKRQGARTDLTFCQVGEKITSSQVGKKLSSSQIVTGTSDQDGTKLENPTMKIYPLQSGHDEVGNWIIQQDEITERAINSNEALAKQMGESRMTIQRYIRLTNLILKLLDMVDDGKIAFTIAVELSYLTEEQQYELYEVMEVEQCTPSLSQANRMKRMSQSGNLDMDAMFSILEQEKPNQREQIKLRADSVAKYFPEDYTPKQKTDLIEQLLKEWYEKHEHEKKHSSHTSRGRAR